MSTAAMCALLEDVVQRACQGGGHLRPSPVAVHAQGLQHSGHHAKFPQLRRILLQNTNVC